MVRIASFCLHSSLKSLLLVQVMVALLFFAPLVKSQSGEITYIYDEMGRLVAVIDASGNAAIYSYDAVGNLLSITRRTAAEVSIIEFTPDGGPVGTTVTIYGTGFSTTPSQNNVSFNGVSANVTAATANKITTSVPASATTGPISITTPLGSAVSSTSFVVGTSTTPTITSFSPTIGTPGTTVNITGTNFETTRHNNRVKFNVAVADVTSATTTTLEASVLSGATSGRISVSTPNGTGTSSDDFFVPPSPYTAADVAYTGRAAVGEVETVSINTANKIGLVVFDGVAGQRISLGLGGVTFGAPFSSGSASVTIYTPSGTVLMAPFNFGTEGNGTPSQVLPVSGTYTMLIDPYATNTGSATITLSEDLYSTISINGAPVTLNVSRVGQNARLTFSGTAGQRVSLGMSAVTLGTPYHNDTGSVAIYNPDGSVLMSPFGFSITYGNGTLSHVLPVSGTYSIILDAYVLNTGNVTLTLSEDLAPPISINGAPAILTFRPGQNTWITFSGTAGQRVTLGMSDVSLGAPYWNDVGTVAMYKPDGSVLISPFGFAVTYGHGTESHVLPVSGNYTILLNPYLGFSGNVTLTLSEDLAPPISINGAPAILTFRPGQNTWITFSGAEGQRISLGMTDLSLGAPYWNDVASVAIYKPDGTVLMSPFGFEITYGDGTPSQILPVSGDYKILLNPYLGFSGNVTLTLSEDLAPPISINGPSVLLNFRPGQNTWMTFSGTAGQRISLGMSEVTLGAPYWNDTGYVTIYHPDGSVFMNQFGFNNIYGNGTPTHILPVTGNYKILLNAHLGFSGSVLLTLSADLTPTLHFNAPPTLLSIRPGQNTWMPFNGSAGMRVSMAMTDVSLGAPYWGDTGNVSIYKADGTHVWGYLGFTTVGRTITSQTLPDSGDYIVFLDPKLGFSGNVSINLLMDASGGLTIGGPQQTLNISHTGQNGIMTFNGTSGQSVIVSISGNGLGNTSVTLLRPDGTTLTSVTSSSGSFNLPLTTLPSTGTYSLVIDPQGFNTGSITVQLHDPGASSATLKADYRFQNTLTSSTGSPPALTNLGSNTFQTATVDGTSTTVLSFAQNDGLSFSPTTGVISNNTYSIVMLFSLAQTSSWRRLADFKNATSDNGLYNHNGKLYLYPSASGSAAPIAANTYVQVVITRDSFSTVTGYVNGTQQFQFNDSSSHAVISAANALRFFRDDNNPAEASAGYVARIRLYDGALTSAQVAALDRLP